MQVIIIYKLEFRKLNFESAVKKQYNDFLDAKEKLPPGQTLQQFWMSFLEMIALFPNTIYFIRSEGWELLFEYVRSVLHNCFA